MDEGLDTGDMLSWHAIDIGSQESTAQLHDRLAALGGEMIALTLRQALSGTASRSCHARLV